MTKIVFSILTASLVLGLGAGRASGQNRSTKDEFERKATTANETARKHNMMDVALHTVSVETGVPQERLQEMHKKNPEAGPAGILIASVMADETKQPPEKFLKSHMDGKIWTAIARDNNVPLDKLNERLDHLQRTLVNPDKSEKVNRPKRRDR